MHAEWVVFVNSFNSQDLWDKPSRAHCAIFRIGQNLRPGFRLFKRLKRLSIPSSEGITSISSFLSPSMRAVRIRLPNAAPYNFLQEIYECTPKIANLYLSGNVGPRSIHLLPHFTSLRTLTLDLLRSTFLPNQHDQLLLPSSISSLILLFPPSFSGCRISPTSSLFRLQYLQVKASIAFIAGILPMIENLEVAVFETSDIQLSSAQVKLCWEALSCNSRCSLRSVKISYAGRPEIHRHMLLSLPAMSFFEAKHIIHPFIVTAGYKRSTQTPSSRWTLITPTIAVAPNYQVNVLLAATDEVA